MVPLIGDPAAVGTISVLPDRGSESSYNPRG